MKSLSPLDFQLPPTTGNLLGLIYPAASAASLSSAAYFLPASEFGR